MTPAHVASIQKDREHLYEVLDYVAKGKVRIIAETFSFDNIAQAYAKVAS